ncbi:DUF4352 domain-containing protein [Nocardiopsis alkaliphila]|uniref:DUF4352 domain-containing protein n=1 Tax=Nocardiopsis alkaliphila TaxID=225762 RepID=UPI000349DAA4|nr:DUF4352 domain-containing protein [Nocardiopsis alkaliphila]
MTHPQQPEQPQQPYSGQPAPSKPGMSTGKRFGIGCGVIILLFLLMGGCMAAISGGSDDTGAARDGSAQDSAESVEEGAEAEEVAEEEEEVVLTAEATDFEPSVLYDGGDHTSVFVTIENNSDDAIEVNPLYFAIVADDGTKKDTTGSLGMSESQIDTVTLNPGQRAEGVVTAEGDFTPASVEFEENLGMGVTVTADVG